jgi:hypothetical protein
MNVNVVLDMSLLAQVSYVDDLSSSFTASQLHGAILDANGEQMTSTQAHLVSDNFRVVHHQATIERSGFSATLFQDIRDPGEYTIAMRGTDGFILD